MDINLARYFIGSDVGIYEELKSKCEREILDEYRCTARSRVGEIMHQAEDRSNRLPVSGHGFACYFSFSRASILRT